MKFKVGDRLRYLYLLGSDDYRKTGRWNIGEIISADDMYVDYKVLILGFGCDWCSIGTVYTIANDSTKYKLVKNQEAPNEI